jgi:hypothetical protein
MRFFLCITIILFSNPLFAQQDSKAMIYNKELKALAGNWTGSMIYTDPAKNNTQVTLLTKLEISSLADSLVLQFNYTDAEGRLGVEKTYLCIYDKEDKLSIDGEQYDIVFTGRKGPRLTLIVEKNNIMENNRLADLKQTIIFGPANLSMVKEVRYMENEFYFIRRRAAFTKNK